jgi:phosphoribosylformylglycinamidine synthase
MAGCTIGIYRVHYFIFALQTTTIMIFTVQIKVMPLKDLLDPQGKAVMGGLQNLGLNQVTDVRIGKHIDLQVEADNKEAAMATAEEAAKKLLANPVMEVYEISVS